MDPIDTKIDIYVAVPEVKNIVKTLTVCFGKRKVRQSKWQKIPLNSFDVP